MKSDKKETMSPVTDQHIFIVDDKKENWDLLSSFFRKSNQKHILAASGEESIRIMSEVNNIALILMDIKMEGMNGIEAMKVIKSGYNIPVIAVTAYAMEGDREELLREGFDEYISKPVDIYSLKEKLDGFLQENPSEYFI